MESRWQGRGGCRGRLLPKWTGRRTMFGSKARRGSAGIQMIRRLVGLCAMAVPVWVVCVYVGMASLRPDFWHMNMSISELGSWGAPHLLSWNILGYILPGLVIAFLVASLKAERNVSGRASFPFVAHTLSGLFLALAGVFPADMNNKPSTTTVVHSVGSFGSGVAFIIAVIWLPCHFRKSSNWQWPSAPLLTMAWGLGLGIEHANPVN
ncbi:DUF998 domain-containing protein [Paucibacter sp. Y2R2-4]|uniref:DUF998 domain-containing protein n=1 Tax=Paucibacter sp. Y2R2-4 TaxID=2893553 RepID=UPI0029624812|nr:DUF998 domain-containing protein [Paucibacter sp. Y2R2-4]